MTRPTRALHKRHPYTQRETVFLGFCAISTLSDGVRVYAATHPILEHPILIRVKRHSMGYLSMLYVPPLRVYVYCESNLLG